MQPRSRLLGTITCELNSMFPPRGLFPGKLAPTMPKLMLVAQRMDPFGKKGAWIMVFAGKPQKMRPPPSYWGFKCCIGGMFIRRHLVTVGMLMLKVPPEDREKHQA